VADVYSRASQNLAGVIPVDAAKITFAGDGSTVFGVGMLTQNIQINYQQQVNRLYEVGTNNTYFIGGRTQGQMGVGRVIGPRAVQVAFYTKYGNMCNARTNTINLSSIGSICGTDASLTGVVLSQGQTGQASKYSMKFCIITNIGITIGAQDMVVNEQLQLMFVSLEVA
jgi:hypothetical protein